MNILKTPEKSKDYFSVAMIRLFIFFFLVFGLFRITGMWKEYEATLVLTTAGLIVYAIIVYYYKRYKESKNLS